jgi:hypothetical protein
MKTLRWIGVIALTVLVTVVIWTATVDSSAQKVDNFAAGGTCNTYNLAGAYPYSAFGTILPNHPLGYPPGPYTSAGVVYLDAAGNFTATAKTSLSGEFTDEQLSGTYTIDENCAVTLIYMDFPLSITYATADRKFIYGIVTVPKTNISIIGANK